MNDRNHARMGVIQSARNVEPKFDEALRDALDCDTGRLDGDIELGLAIEVLHGHGAADHTAGDTDGVGHFIIVDRFALLTDSRGFCTTLEYDSCDDAIRIVDEFCYPMPVFKLVTYHGETQRGYIDSADEDGVTIAGQPYNWSEISTITRDNED